MNDYNQEQLEAIQIVRHYLKTFPPTKLTRLKARIGNYLRFRKEANLFLQKYFSEVCTQKCYQDHYSACCNREGITTFFADVVINVLMSADEDIDRLLHVLSLANPGMKCVYLGKRGCLWSIKPIVCEMFLCEHARETVFDRLAPRKPRPSGRGQGELYKNIYLPYRAAKHCRKAEPPPFRAGRLHKDALALKEWERLVRREKSYTWPSHPVLFDELEAYFIRAGYSSSLMYFHNSPGLLRVKRLARKKKIALKN